MASGRSSASSAVMASPSVMLASCEPRARGERAVEVLAPARREVVDDADVVAALEQGVDEVRADEAGPAGHERAHAAKP